MEAGERHAAEEEFDTDALCALLDPLPAEEANALGVDELLGLPAPSASSQGPELAAPELPIGDLPRKRPRRGMQPPPGLGPPPPEDLPMVELAALPKDLEPKPFVIAARFDMRCEIDLRKVAFGIRDAEYNPRKHGCVTIRFQNPRVTAMVRGSGVCQISGAVSRAEDEVTIIKHSAKKVAALVKRCGHEGVGFFDFRVASLICKVTLDFPIDLRRLREEWQRHAVYEPETYCGCVFKTRNPKTTFLITAGGCVSISGIRTVNEAWSALRRIYPILHALQGAPAMRASAAAS